MQELGDCYYGRTVAEGLNVLYLLQQRPEPCGVLSENRYEFIHRHT